MKHFLSGLKAKDAFTVLEYCLDTGKDEPVLRDRALQLIQHFAKEALESHAFFNASHAAIKLVYLQNLYSVPEIFLFNAVINLFKKIKFIFPLFKAYKWAKHQCDGSEDPDKLRLQLGPILDLIRFSTMDHFEFCRDVGA
jgi:hypothetical protein